jgi:hypothetical protein
MNATTMKTSTTVCLAQGRFGAPQPQFEIRSIENVEARRLRAAAFRLAADVEMATPPKEAWTVHVASNSDRAVVWIELMTGNLGEAARAMSILEATVKG